MSKSYLKGFDAVGDNNNKHNLLLTVLYKALDYRYYASPVDTILG